MKISSRRNKKVRLTNKGNLSLYFIGTGSAFAKTLNQNNLIIVKGSDHLLIDCGTKCSQALHNVGLPLVNIKNYLITHSHADHIGGLEELAGMNMHCYGSPRTGQAFKPTIISSPAVLAGLWEHSLKGGLGAILGRDAQLEDYFDILAVHPRVGPVSNRCPSDRPDRFNMLGRYEFTIFPTDHVQVRCRYDWPTLGLLMTDRKTGQTAFFSGDTRFDPEGLGEMMAAAKINFHEVQLGEHPAPIHALLSEMRTLPEAVRKKTILYHYSDAWDTGAYDFVADEFAGFAQPQHRYTLFDGPKVEGPKVQGRKVQGRKVSDL